MRDHRSAPGDEDPLDAALGELHDLAELEQRFAALDVSIATQSRSARALDHRDDSVEDDPFADLAAVLREQRAIHDRDARQSDSDEESRGVDDLLDADADADSSEDDHDEISEEIELRCQEALDAIEAEELPRARELAMEAVRLDDEHPFPTFVLGLVAEREGDLDTARDMADLALGTAETNPDAIGLRAHIHVREHQLEEADRLLRFGVAHNPDEASLHEGIARVALARGRYDEALQAARTTLRIDPNNHGAHAVRSAALEEGADRGALLAALRQGAQLHPEDPYAMVELASAELEHGNLDRARALLLRAQRLAPRDRHIEDVRSVIEHVDSQRLLRPVPGMLRWLRDFPGGLIGFVVGFLVAAMPLHALAIADPRYRVPTIALLGGWGFAALYAWIAPSVLTHRLNQRSARDAYARMRVELGLDPAGEGSAPPPSTAPVDLDRLADVASMLLTARDRRRAVELLTAAADTVVARGDQPATAGAATADDVAAQLRRLARELRGARARVRMLALGVPGAVRGLIAVGALLVVSAPAIATWRDTTPAVWQAVALTSLALAWLLTTLERSARRRVDDTFVAVELAASGDGDAAALLR